VMTAGYAAGSRHGDSINGHRRRVSSSDVAAISASRGVQTQRLGRVLWVGASV